jgi:hypothetical protein
MAMFIKTIVIEGADGDVEISHSETGATVAAHDVEIAVRRDDPREERYSVAYNAANGSPAAEPPTPRRRP